MMNQQKESIVIKGQNLIQTNFHSLEDGDFQALLVECLEVADELEELARNDLTIGLVMRNSMIVLAAKLRAKVIDVLKNQLLNRFIRNPEPTGLLGELLKPTKLKR